MQQSQQKYVATLSIDLPPAEMLKLEKAAQKKNMTPNEFLLFLVEVSTHLIDTSDSVKSSPLKR